MAKAYLQYRMGREETDLELVPHTSSHITSKRTKITNKSLTLKADNDSRQEIFMSVLKCLKRGELIPDSPKCQIQQNGR